MSLDTAELDKRFMRAALELARVGEKTAGAGPIGCIIVKDETIIGKGHNEVALRCDPSAHAEIVAMRRAGEAAGSAEFRGATLYSTLQPCGMCSMASIWGKIGRIVYGAGRDDVHKLYFEDKHLDTLDFITDAFRNDISVTGGILKDECAALYYSPTDNPPLEEQSNL